MEVSLLYSLSALGQGLSPLALWHCDMTRNRCLIVIPCSGHKISKHPRNFLNGRDEKSILVIHVAKSLHIQLFVWDFPKAQRRFPLPTSVIHVTYPYLTTTWHITIITLNSYPSDQLRIRKVRLHVHLFFHSLCRSKFLIFLFPEEFFFTIICKAVLLDKLAQFLFVREWLYFSFIFEGNFVEYRILGW